jgi:hypothetical protein
MSDEAEDSPKQRAAMVPMAWLLAALWAVTMALGGAWATAVKSSIDSIPAQQQKITALEVKVDTLERHDLTKVDQSAMADLKSRLDRIERKLDEVVDRRGR